MSRYERTAEEQERAQQLCLARVELGQALDDVEKKYKLTIIECMVLAFDIADSMLRLLSECKRKRKH